MIYILTSFLIFIVTVALQLCLHIILVKYHYKTYKTITLFLLGLIVNILILVNIKSIVLYRTFIQPQPSWWTLDLFWSSIFLYLIFTLDYIVFFTSPYIGDESPSSKILLHVKAKKKMTYQEIERKFSDKDLIDKRLSDMRRSKLLIKSNSKYFLLPKGLLLMRIISFYRNLLGWKLLG